MMRRVKMTRRAKWSIAGVCAALALAAVVLVVWRMHERRLAEEAAAEREALYRQFGIDAPGTRRFVPLPSILSHNHGRAEIGRKLFHDRRLTSSQKSQGLVCGACHWLGAGGTDSKIHHGMLTRPVYNASFATVYLHDGSMPDLQSAVTKMIEHPHFSGGGPLAGVVSRLADDEGIVRRFTTVYGQDGLADTNVVCFRIAPETEAVSAISTQEIEPQKGAAKIPVYVCVVQFDVVFNAGRRSASLP